VIAANGENRRYFAYAFASAFVAAIGTKLGEWVVERIREHRKATGRAA
jgi:hypothetical protein